MPVNDSITSLANASITVTRTARAPFVNGRRVAGAESTIGPISVVAQPAFNLNRVIGGADLDGNIENQQVVEIYQIHTTTQLMAGEDGESVTRYEPDIVTFRGKQWTVARVEEWNLDGEIHYHAVITRRTKGGV